MPIRIAAALTIAALTVLAGPAAAVSASMASGERADRPCHIETLLLHGPAVTADRACTTSA